MKLCPNCAKPLKEGVAFCTHCGAKTLEISNIEKHSIQRHILKMAKAVSVMWLILGIAFIILCLCAAYDIINRTVYAMDRNLSVVRFLIISSISITLYMLCIVLSFNSKRQVKGLKKYKGFNILFVLTYIIIFICELYLFFYRVPNTSSLLGTVQFFIMLIATVLTITNFILQICLNSRIKKHKNVLAQSDQG